MKRGKIFGIRLEGVNAFIFPAGDRKKLLNYRASVRATVNEMLAFAQNKGISFRCDTKILIPPADTYVFYPFTIVFQTLQKYSVKRFPALVIRESMCKAQPIFCALARPRSIKSYRLVHRRCVEAGKYLQ